MICPLCRAEHYEFNHRCKEVSISYNRFLHKYVSKIDPDDYNVLLLTTQDEKFLKDCGIKVH